MCYNLPTDVRKFFPPDKKGEHCNGWHSQSFISAFCQRSLEESRKAPELSGNLGPGQKIGLDKKLEGSGQKTQYTLSAYLHPDSLEENSEFGREGENPAQFYLKSAPPRQRDAPAKESAETLTPTWYKELDLHPILAHFAFANPKFGRGKSIKTKTIVSPKGKEVQGVQRVDFSGHGGSLAPELERSIGRVR